MIHELDAQRREKWDGRLGFVMEIDARKVCRQRRAPRLLLVLGPEHERIIVICELALAQRSRPQFSRRAHSQMPMPWCGCSSASPARQALQRLGDHRINAGIVNCSWRARVRRILQSIQSMFGEPCLQFADHLQRNSLGHRDHLVVVSIGAGRHDANLGPCAEPRSLSERTAKLPSLVCGLEVLLGNLAKAVSQQPGARRQRPPTAPDQAHWAN